MSTNTTPPESSLHVNRSINRSISASFSLSFRPWCTLETHQTAYLESTCFELNRVSEISHAHHTLERRRGGEEVQEGSPARTCNHNAPPPTYFIETEYCSRHHHSLPSSSLLLRARTDSVLYRRRSGMCLWRSSSCFLYWRSLFDWGSTRQRRGGNMHVIFECLLSYRPVKPVFLDPTIF